MNYYKLGKDVYYRRYGDVGYITSTGLFNDKTVDSIGAMFLSALSREPQSLDELTNKIAPQFIDADKELIRSDAQEFFDIFVEDGFLASGESPEEARANDTGFSYNVVEPSTMKKDFTPAVIRTPDDTQSMLDAYFLEHPTLTSFQIELTSRCNERCVHCYIPHECKLDDIDPALFYRVLDELEALGTWHLTLSGGEPMLHPQFVDFVRKAKQRDFYVSVLSNLTLLDDEIVGVLKEGNKSSVQVSLYSMNPERHDAITKQAGSFEKTKAAILTLIDNDIPVQVSCPSMKGNKGDFKDVLRWANDHKIRAITDYMIMAEYNHDTSNLAHRLTPAECGEVISDIIEWDKDYQKDLLSEDFLTRGQSYADDMDSPLCGVGVSTCCMVSNGNIYPCPGWQLFTCGNVNESSLEDIWLHSDKMNYLRNLKRKDMKPCISCEQREFCTPCMVRNANESPTGDPLEVNPYFCEVAKVNKELVLDWREKHL